MKILAIDTSCDETAVAVTEKTQILANVIWSQASLHAQFGGVMPSLAQRQHEERIDFVIKKALKMSGVTMEEIGAIAVTCGPGLAIALGVGIKKAKELAEQYNKRLIAVNHIEGHLLSPLARDQVNWPAMGMVISGGHTELVLIEELGKYKIVAETMDDALGEALDKAARMLGLGYPGGALLEKMARLGNPKAYTLPRPMAGREEQNEFSYSGLKTAFWRMTEEMKKTEISREQIYDLAASFQNRALEHLVRVSKNVLNQMNVKDLLVGGGVAANLVVRRRLRKLGAEMGIKVHFPYNKRLMGDNAAMIGIVGNFKAERGEFSTPSQVDRSAKWRVDEELVIKS